MSKVIKSIYVIGSLRNPNIPVFAKELRALGLDVFDDWFASGPETDDYWKKYEQVRGRTYGDAIKGYMAEHVFSFDKHHLDRTDAAVMLCPAGRSGHLELGYTKGRGKPAFMVFEKEPEDRWDVMTQFCTEIFFSRELFAEHLKENYIKPKKLTPYTPTPLSAEYLRCIRCLMIGGHHDWCPLNYGG